MRGKKIISVMLVIMMLSVIFISGYVEVLEIHHDCIGEDCPICRAVELYDAAIRQIVTGLCMAVVQVGVISAIVFVKKYKNQMILCETPVSAKVRMDN